MLACLPSAEEGMESEMETGQEKEGVVRLLCIIITAFVTRNHAVMNNAYRGKKSTPSAAAAAPPFLPASKDQKDDSTFLLYRH